VPVRVSVSAADVRGWSSAVRRDGLLALTATCVLAVLPDDHAARPEIEQLRARAPGTFLSSRGRRMPPRDSRVLYSNAMHTTGSIIIS
jgi:hypothetical protein